MITQNRDGSLSKEPPPCWMCKDEHGIYHAGVSARPLDTQIHLIDYLITFAFDTLGAWYLDLRVYDEAMTLAADERCNSSRIESIQDSESSISVAF